MDPDDPTPEQLAALCKFKPPRARRPPKGQANFDVYRGAKIAPPPSEPSLDWAAFRAAYAGGTNPGGG
jgi:hypothetical protein